MLCVQPEASLRSVSNPRVLVCVAAVALSVASSMQQEAAWISLEDVGASHVVVFVLTTCFLVWIAVARKRSVKTNNEPLFAFILGISTGNPGFKVSREEALRHATEFVDPRSPVAPVLERIYNNSLIEKRYFCVPDIGGGDGRAEELRGDRSRRQGEEERGPNGNPQLFYPADGSFQVDTDKRFQRFAECALPLATEVSKRAMTDVGVRPTDIGRIVVVTSTGVCGPGLDGELVRSIGLHHSVEREVVSFQGCGAGINGLRLACQYAVTHPGRLALLVSVELPSLHMHKSDSVNDAILHAIFGDGCAVAIIGGLPAKNAKPGSLAVLDNRSWLVDGTADGIEMMLGENGVSCKLSKRLPDYVKTNVSDFVDEMLGAQGVDKSDIDFWALHPGGHRIVEETRKSLHLSLQETEGCWGVLRDYGNMVSATVLFVLARALEEHKRLLDSGGKGLKHVVALSFSPGVTVEGLLLQAFSNTPGFLQ